MGEKAKAAAKGLEAVAKVAAHVSIVASLGTKRVIAHSPVKRRVAMGRVARARATKFAASSSKDIVVMETIAVSAMNDRWQSPGTLLPTTPATQGQRRSRSRQQSLPPVQT